MLKQRGAAPTAIIVVVVLVIAAVGGYFLLNKGGGGGLPAVPGLPGGAALNPNCKYNDPDLCKFINNFKVITNYSVKSTTSGGQAGGKFENLLEVAGQDRTHTVYSQDGKETYNVIVIGDITYTKDYSDNKWWKQKQAKQKQEVEKVQEKIDPKKDIEKAEKEDKTTYKKISKEPCGKLTCFKYQVINPDFTNSTDYIWFDDKEYLLRKERTEDKDGTVSETDMNYDKVNISEPSPTKDAKPDQIILPTGGVIPGMSEQEMKDLQKAAEESKKMMKEQPQLPQAPAPEDTGE